MKHHTSIDTKFVGQDFDAFLQEEGIALEVEARTIKKVLAALVHAAARRGRGGSPHGDWFQAQEGGRHRVNGYAPTGRWSLLRRFETALTER